MLPHSRPYDDPFTSPAAPGINFRWAARVARPQRFSNLRLTRFKIVTLLLILGIAISIRSRLRLSKTGTQAQALIVPNSNLLPSNQGNGPRLDIEDAFQSYKFRSTCNVSSLDLHTPFSPLCQDRISLLTAMSQGGRIGMDAPYMPQGCDMRWFSSEEVCEILGRFEQVVLIGDSMLRHIIGSINILVRKDLGYGAVTEWNFSPEERKECFCNDQFDVKACSVQGIYKTGDVMDHDPTSLSCTNPINVIMEQIVRYPIPTDEIKRLKATLSGKNAKHGAIILGHGLWSNLDLRKGLHWLDDTISAVSSSVGKDWPALFVTPNAAGKEKPEEWIVSQGDKALMLFEEAMGIEVMKRGIEHLGTWNMSIQTNKRDGVHLDMKGNLLKAMMVVNWLNMIPRE